VLIEKPGLIIGDDGRSQPCIVSSMLHDRARISLLRRHDVPREFTLSLRGRAWRGRVMWRTALQVGIELIDAPIEHVTPQDL
jgi:hypothetical protein